MARPAKARSAAWASGTPGVSRSGSGRSTRRAIGRRIFLVMEQEGDWDRQVEDLAVAHRAKGALRHLMAGGMDATPALRRGLSHPSSEVRVGCCMVLDHFMDEAAVPELMANLTHE